MNRATSVPAFAAVDLGASSGRVVRAEVDGGRVTLAEVARFSHAARTDSGGTLRWDLSGLYERILDGLAAAGRAGPLAGIGIDSWAVDYGLLDDGGSLLAEPVAYRDGRTAASVDLVHARLDPSRLYEITGIAHLPFNTVYQLAAERGGPLWDRAAQMLLIPDLISYWLTGQRVTERTNASTTALLDQRTGQWSAEILSGLGIDEALFAPLVEPGTVIGALSAEVRARTGLGEVPVIAVGAHDTASAIAGVPATGTDFAYISCGTWSLVGFELRTPVLTQASRAANFTNERGVDGTVRYLRNVMGLWLLQESMRTWRGQGVQASLQDLLARAAQLPAREMLIDVDHPDFLPPGDMPARIAAHLRVTGQQVPDGPAQVTRCILDSLALAYRRATRAAAELSEMSPTVLHLVGGGSQNGLLCQASADATELPVLAGPVESTAWGNVLVQARAAGVLQGDLAALRQVGGRGLDLTRYDPDPVEGRAWADADRRLPHR